MDRLDQLAEILHNGWWKYQVDLGIKLGPDKIDDRNEPDSTKWTHPHLTSWSSKATAEKNQDRFEAALILNAWFRGTLTTENLPELIHESWREWLKVVAVPGQQPHPHDKPYAEVHANNGGREHVIQAQRVYVHLEKTYPR